MYPILYDQITAGTVPQHNGLGILSSAISCFCTQERNGVYELTLEYPITGLHAEELAVRRILKVKPNFADEPQLFRIDRIGKVMNGKFTVYAKHISYDLSGNDIVSGEASNIVAACALLQSAAQGYSITTDKTVSGNFKIDAPSSVRSWFGGKKGSILDVYGTSELKYNNFNIQFLLHAGQDRGVTIMYSKNLLELSQEIGDTLYTHVRCFYKGGDNTVVSGNKVATGLTLDVPKTLIVDLSSDYENAPTVAQLTTRAQEYIRSHNLTTPTNNIKLDFVQSGELSNRVDLCDTVNVYYEALGITRVQVKCIRTVWDCLKERYSETEFGDAKVNITDTIAQNNQALSERPTSTTMENAIAHATELITGNLGGYVVMHDANGDGKPDEILIMNTESIETANQVWRFNKSGLGYSNSYDGNYGLALTSDGQIVADRITSGTLNANVIKAGIISDVNNRSSIDLTSGIAKMYYLNALYRLRLLGNNDAVKFQVIHNVGSGTNMTFYLDDGTDVGGLSCGNSSGLTVVLNDKNGNRKATLGDGLSVIGNISAGGNITATGNISASSNLSATGTITAGGNISTTGTISAGKVTGSKFGSIYIPNSQNTNVVDLFAGTYGGYMYLRNNAGTEKGRFFVGSDGDGLLYLFDSYGSGNILCKGQNGNVTCVSVTQTSSRNVKKNIENIDDTDKILELQAVKFDFKNERLGTDQRGFIAEDVAEILPNLVTNGDTPAINYTGMIPYLQDIIKKQEKRITALENKLNAIIEKNGEVK